MSGPDREDQLQPATIGGVIARHAQAFPTAATLRAPGREALTYAALDRLIRDTRDHLNAHRLCRAQTVDVSITGARVARSLGELALEFGLPEEIVLDNGLEGTGRAMFEWPKRTGVRLRFIGPGKQARSERLRRVRQRQVPRRRLQPALVPVPAARPRRDREPG